MESSMKFNLSMSALLATLFVVSLHAGNVPLNWRDTVTLTSFHNLPLAIINQVPQQSKSYNASASLFTLGNGDLAKQKSSPIRYGNFVFLGLQDGTMLGTEDAGAACSLCATGNRGRFG